MLRNQENVINENKEYMKEVQKREEQSFKEMVEPLENELFNKACQMEEKANLIEQYLGQIVKMQKEIDRLQEEVDELNGEIQLRKVNTEKISMAQQTICKVKDKVISFANTIKEKVSFKFESEEKENVEATDVEVTDVEVAISDVRQSNLEEDKKKRLYRVLNKLIKILSE